jgi:Domain of unknown function (DUF4188)
MAQVIPHFMTAEVEGDFVVFLIGMRINKLWKIHKWFPVFLAVRRVLRELDAHPESGFLGYFGAGRHRSLLTVQYWRSFEHLESYARSQEYQHWPAWIAFNKRSGNSRGDVGIWHETYQVHAGEYETVYSGMPLFGLGKVGKLVPVSGSRASARGRLRASVESPPPAKVIVGEEAHL